MAAYPLQRIGSYQLQSLLGGNQAQVYLAQHPVYGQVAIKLLHNNASMSRQATQRFMREARLLKHMRHPNILRLLDAGSTKASDGHSYSYIATEYLPDGALDRWLQECGGQLAEPQALYLSIQIADALAYAHECGIIHRDLKPSNVLLQRTQGQAILSDFGIASELAANTISQGRQIMGTLAYMSPEQTLGEHAYVRRGSDIYSFGVMLYEMLSGYQPRKQPGLADVVVVQLIRNTPLPPLREVASHVMPEVAVIVETCIQPRREHRYQTMRQVAEALRTVATNHGYPIPKSHSSPLPTPQLLPEWAIVISVVAIVLMLVLVLVLTVIGVSSTQSTNLERPTVSERLALRQGFSMSQLHADRAY